MPFQGEAEGVSGGLGNMILWSPIVMMATPCGGVVTSAPLVNPQKSSRRDHWAAIAQAIPWYVRLLLFHLSGQGDS